MKPWQQPETELCQILQELLRDKRGMVKCEIRLLLLPLGRRSSFFIM